MRRAMSAIVVAASVVAAGTARADVPQFEQRVAHRGGLHGEPGLAIDGPFVYVVEPTGDTGTVLFRSQDGGSTFDADPLATGGSGDSDVAVDADGVVYVSDLFPGRRSAPGVLPVSTSLDHGRTFARTVLSGGLTPGSFDRQWTAAEGHGHVVNIANVSQTRTDATPTGLVAFVSRDTAQTFSGPHVIDAEAGIGGPLAFSADGLHLYVAYARGTQLRIGRSLDGGDTWETRLVTPLPRGEVLFPVVATDSIGTVYVAWVEGPNGLQPLRPVRLARSTDGGNSWSAPIAVSEPGGSTVMPWLAAGGTGHVDIAYYQARSSLDSDRGPDLGGPDTTWDLVLAQSLDATGATPSLTHTVVAASFHTGSICTMGGGCLTPQEFGFVNGPLPLDRQVLDFFEIAATADGRMFATYPRDRGPDAGAVGDLIEPTADLMLARQTAGPVL